MPRRRGRGVPVFALILVLVGGVLLLQNLDIIPWELWFELWRLWPVLIIGVGVNLILGRRIPWLATVLVGALFVGAVAGAALLVERGGELVSTGMEEVLGDLRFVDVEIGFGAGGLKIMSLPESSPNLVEATFETPGRGAVTSLRRSNDSAELRFRMERGRWFRSTSSAEWEIRLSRTPALSIIPNPPMDRDGRREDSGRG